MENNQEVGQNVRTIRVWSIRANHVFVWMVCRHIYRIWNEFSFHTVFMKRVSCFYIPEPLAKGYKTHNDLLQILFITCLTHKNVRKTGGFFLPILLRKTRLRREVTYDVIDELRRLSLSKCFPVLCHKLIYEIAIFHSINGETCDNL